MKKTIVKFLLSVALALALALPALAQAVLLPNGRQQFLDANGDPLAAGTVGMYVPSTLTPKNTWTSAAQSSLNTNPVVLDSAGSALIYGSGTYRQIVKDVFGNTIWDANTAGVAGPFPAWGGTSTGSGNAQTVAASSFVASSGNQIAFKAGFGNTGNATLTITGVGTYPIYADTPAGPALLTGGEIAVGGVYQLTYDSVLGGLHLLAQMTGPFVVANGSISGSNITLKSSGVPTPTAVGRVEWGTTNNALYVGNGASASVIWNGLMPGGLWGCETGNNAADPTNDIDFTAGTVVADGAGSRATCTALTKQLDTTWVAGTGQGMRSSAAALANGTWFVFAVWPAGGTVDYFATTSASAATALTQLQAMSGGASYAFARRLGAIVRSGGAIRAYTQDADTFLLAVPVQDVNTTNPGTSAVQPVLTVPIGIKVTAKIIAGYKLGAGYGSASYMLVTSPSQTDSVPSATLYSTTVDEDGGFAFDVTVSQDVLTNTTGNIRYRVSQSDANMTVYVLTNGWVDTRGRLN